ncbi:ATP-binding protein [Pseudacidovorax intermedius]|uniref:ATP-binding protein n=1 Tax=Pseudacidovorax intermedius TaxID=433924 RepID=UPI000AFB0C40|nr:ATP-binding protein [Pseudacidovorax intermedius]
MKATQVFTPGKEPEVTYTDDHLKEHARILRDALDAGAAVISLSGPSKSGKTVFIEKNVGHAALVTVTGAGVTSPKILWDRVFDIIGTPVSKSTTTTDGKESAIGGKLGGEAGVPFLAKGSGEINAAFKTSGSTADKVDIAVDYLQLLIRELSGTGLVVFIDDFHYIPKDVQTEVSNQIKEAIRHGVVFVVASVPYHSDDAVRANSDLRGRIVKLDFDYWRPEELAKIANKGFAALNTAASPAYVEALSKEAAGSPQLMQTLCLNTCFENDVREKGSFKQLSSNREAIKSVCTRTAATADYSSTVAKMIEGPKTRGTDRNSYLIAGNEIVDVYPLILRAVASDPPELTQRYSNLQKRIQAICIAGNPSGSSVTGACSHIANIANSAEGRNVIEWDGENDVLDIRDPYLLFFLRWKD